MSLTIRKSSKDDLSFLEKLEETCFSEFQRTSRRNLRLSLSSPFQEVWIAEYDGKEVGAIVLFLYKKSLRIYSLATLPKYQGKGIGKFLVENVIQLGISRKLDKIILEADATNSGLIAWYEKQDFKVIKTIKDYYEVGADCVKMEYLLKKELPITEHKTKNIIVVNQPTSWKFTDINAKIISVKEYIANSEYHLDNSLRIFNLCTSYQYQSYGYYVSLLASARGQRVIPNVTTIRDVASAGITKTITGEVGELLQEELKNIKNNHFDINIYFGQTNTRGLKKVAFKLSQLFEMPLFKVFFIKDENEWIIKKVQPLNMKNISNEEFLKVNEFAKEYFEKKRFNQTRLTSYKYDLAILVNPQEGHLAPSCPDALKKFKKAANKRGIYTEFITKNDIDRINEFDALFIRETTSVNNHTYKISRLAYAEGLVVIDDPWSILRCSNKIYQNELFKHNKILTPKTITYTKNIFKPKDLDDVNFPMVVKQPDSAFSLGVKKVNNREEAITVLTELFKKSDMLICQEFLYSDFDWRIGLIDNTPIYACRYYMSKGHWQIYNWQGEKNEITGAYDCVEIKDVPRHVLQTAQKAASLIGDGLYGVDLKEINGKAYVIEINDNPNVDDEVENLLLGDKLYDMIIDSIYNRIEIARNVNQYIFSK